MIAEFYGPFHEGVAKTVKDADRQSGERALGIDPNSGKNVIARIGRFGAMIQIGATTETEKPKFASMPMGKSIETITLEEALAAFNGPASLGDYKGEKVTTGSGKFGPFIKWTTLYVSIPKNTDMNLSNITLEQAIPLIEKKIETEKNKNIQAFDYEKDKIYVLNGMYGPYIKYGKTNFRLPKGGKDATDLTLEDCVAIVSAGKFGNKG